MNVLVLNCGSSSIKYQVLNMDAEPKLLAKGIVEKVGLTLGSFTYKALGKDKIVIEKQIPNHSAGMDLILKMITDKSHGILKSLNEINAVGHRVAHGGEFFTESVLINKDVKEKINKCSELAPLHNPANLIGIETMEELLPNAPQVAVFDTSFHHTMPAKAYTYAIPYKYYTDYKIRRYGFHGTSHKFVAEKACNILGCNIKDKKIITCHLGNGASITAVNKGESVDTSMGFTPVSGLVMGTRAGNLDLGVLLYIAKKENLDIAGMNDLINKKSGVLGISGISSDFRDLSEASEKGNKRATIALDVFSYSVKKYIGAYAAIMNGVDIIVFTGGIGENDTEVREEVCKDMNYLGIKIDNELNSKSRGKDTILSIPESKTKVLLVTTDEELVIAMDTFRLSK